MSAFPSQPSSEIATEKRRLRRSLLKARQSLSAEDWRDRSDRLSRQIARCRAFVEAKTVLGYFHFRNEPDIEGLVTGDRVWGFPRCVEKALVWHRWALGEPLQTGAFGIREPHPTATLVRPETVDLILVPAVACDTRGYRLGYGGGFYDRLLSSPDWQHIPTLGIVFDFGYVPQLPIELWDRPLDGVCTESRLQWRSD